MLPDTVRYNGQPLLAEYGSFGPNRSCTACETTFCDLFRLEYRQRFFSVFPVRSQRGDRGAEHVRSMPPPDSLQQKRVTSQKTEEKNLARMSRRQQRKSSDGGFPIAVLHHP